MEWRRPPEDLTDHVVLCNLSEQVRCIVAELHDPTVGRKPPIVLVVQNPALWENHPEWRPGEDNDYTRDHFYVLLDEGGPASAANLRRAGITRARAAVILADPEQEDLADARSTLVALAIERENPEVHTVMELIRSINRVHLRSTEVNEVVCVGDMAEKLIAQSCITPGVKNIFTRLLTNAQDSNRVFILPTPAALQGTSYRELARRAIRTRAPFVLCGFVRSDFHPPADAERGEAVVVGTTTGEHPPAESDTAAGGDTAAGADTAAKGAATEDTRGAPGADPGPHAACGAPARGQDVYARQSFVLNPRGGVEPGKDTPLSDRDQLVVIACERPVLEQHLLPPGA